MLHLLHQHEDMALNEKQQNVFNACINGDYHVFCTGEGGTGKSRLLSELVSTYRTNSEFKDKHIAVTASTGLAALNVGGVTLHSFAGVQIIEDNLVEMIKRARRRKSYANWIDTDILIIDEISMISATLFDNLSLVAQDIRGSTEPFGGMRLIMFGDFLQLPPISKGNSRTSRVFESFTWQKMLVRCYMLSDIMRQSDITFKSILSSLRIGECNAESNTYMQNLSRDLRYDDSIEPVKLYPLRNSVDEYNIEKLNCINSKEYTYQSVDFGDFNILKQCIAPRTITLKTGAQVMIILNLSPIIVNGTLGTVTGFKYHSDTKTVQPIVTVMTVDNILQSIDINICSWESIAPDGIKIVAKRMQIPIILAWATTIHKSQGQTISRLSVDLKGVFEYGQAYVALSRAIDSSNLQVKNFTRGKIKADSESVKFYERIKQQLDEDDSKTGTVVNKLQAAKVFVGFAD